MPTGAGARDRGACVSRRSVIRLAQLSDTHLVGDGDPLPFGLDSAASLAAVVDAFPAPDVAVMTGDLADNGSADAYRRVLALTSGFADELHVVAGNHDDPAAMNQVLGAGVDLGAVRLSSRWTMLLVNSQWLGHGAGRLAPETLAALDEALAKTRRRHVVVAMHHPPVSPCDDPYCRITNSAEVLDVLERHQQVRAVLSGHLHRAFDNTRGGIRFLGAPSTCSQLIHGGEPHFVPTSAPPAARLIDLHGDGAVTYQTVSARYEHAEQ